MPKAIPKVHFTIEYLRVDGTLVETTGSSADRAVLHHLLDEYLDNNTAWDDDTAVGFEVHGACTCAEQRPNRTRTNPKERES